MFCGLQSCLSSALALSSQQSFLALSSVRCWTPFCQESRVLHEGSLSLPWIVQVFFVTVKLSLLGVSAAVCHSGLSRCARISADIGSCWNHSGPVGSACLLSAILLLMTKSMEIAWLVNFLGCDPFCSAWQLLHLRMPVHAQGVSSRGQHVWYPPALTG